MDRKIAPKSSQSTLSKSERAIAPAWAPRMLVHDHIRSILVQSSLVRQAVQTAIADALQGGIEVNRHRVATPGGAAPRSAKRHWVIGIR